MPRKPPSHCRNLFVLDSPEFFKQVQADYQRGGLLRIWSHAFDRGDSGDYEREWEIEIAPDQQARLAAALGVSRDPGAVLAELARRFDQLDADDRVARFLKEKAIDFTTTNSYVRY